MLRRKVERKVLVAPKSFRSTEESSFSILKNLLFYTKPTMKASGLVDVCGHFSHLSVDCSLPLKSASSISSCSEPASPEHRLSEITGFQKIRLSRQFTCCFCSFRSKADEWIYAGPFIWLYSLQWVDLEAVLWVVRVDCVCAHRPP